MRTKIRYRVLAGILVLCMVENGPAIYAAGSADYGMQETVQISESATVDEATSENILETIIEESVGETVDRTEVDTYSKEESLEESMDRTEVETSETDCAVENSTDVEETTTESQESIREEAETVEEDSTSSETIETVESSEVIETVIEEDVSENAGAYKISGAVTDITNQSATYSFEVEGIQEGEYAYVKMYCFAEGKVEEKSTTKSIPNLYSGEFLLKDLYADMDYTVWAAMYTDNTYTEELTRTEELHFHTLSNEMHYKADVTFTNITNNSVTVNIVPSEELLSTYQELNSYIGVQIKYRVAGSANEYIDGYAGLYKSNGYTKSLELTNLYAGTDYDIKVIWPALGNSGKELEEYNVTTLDSRINYNFSVEGDRIGEGIVHFEITSCYEENEEFILYIYRADSNGDLSNVFTTTLNAENNYTCESYYGMLEEWDVEYTIWGELRQRDDSGRITVNVLTTDKIVKKVEKTKVFEVSVVEDSVTYATAKIEVKWINTDAIGRDEISFRLETGSSGWTAPYLTLKKGEKEQEIIELFDLEPGKTYDCYVPIVINDHWFYFEAGSFSTRAYNFETFSEVKKPSQEDIARKWKEIKFDYQLTESYEREVNHTDGGLLSKETLQNAINYINLCRYTAGVPSDVIYDEECSSLCNATAELNRLNGGFGNTRPDGITDEFYERACFMQFRSLGLSGFNGNKLMAALPTWMVADTGFGYRRDLLDPALYVIGLGRSGMYTRGYFKDSSERTFDKGYVHWPAANAPIELTFCAYCFNLVPDFELYSNDDMTLYLSSEYDNIKSDTNITVQVTNQKNGKTWNLTRVEDIFEAKNYVYMTSDHSMQFGLDDTCFYKGDEVTVTVTGTTINGVDAPITYTMNFFSIEDIEVPDILVESISIVSDDSEVMVNKSIQMEAQILPANATNKKILWSVESADGKGQADITEDGVLTGKMEGLVKVTAVCESNPEITSSVDINVTESRIPVESIILSKTSLRLEKGDTGYISVTLEPRDTTDNMVVYTSGDSNKVSVENGYVHALEVTETPVVITVSAGSLSAECMVEVYENTEDVVDKNYDTRITDILMSGESNVYIGESGIIKFYPVTNGQGLTASEYEIDITCDEKFLSIEPMTSTDAGCWYQLTGTKTGKQKLTVKMTSKVEGNANPETVTKNFTYTVKQKTGEEATEKSSVPVLAKNSITINQNTDLGTALDIRLMEGNADIIKVYLTSDAGGGTENLFSIIQNEGLYYIQTKEIGPNKKYKLILHVDTAQGSWEYPVTVTTKKSFPSVSIKQTVKTNVQILNEDAVLKITGKEQIKNITFKTDSTDFYQKSVEGTGMEYYLTIGQSEHGKKLNKKGIVEISFEGYRAVYSKSVTLATVSKKIKSHTLVSDVKKVILNSTECGDVPTSVKMSLKNSTEKYPVKIFAGGTNNKAKQMLQDGNIYFTYNKNMGTLNVFAKKGASKGTYKYKLTGYTLENGETVNTVGSITLTVVVATAKPALTLKASGNIDLIARSGSCVTYAPTVKNYAGRVASVELEGDDAAKFYARVDANGRIKVYVRERAMVYPKTAYNLGIKATLTNGYVCDVVNVKIKPKQSSFKAMAKQSTITLCRNEVNWQPVEINVKSPANSQIAYIKVVSIPEGISYNSENKTIKITDSSKVKAGKTYKIVFEVTPKGAHRSIKPAKVTLKIKVK